MSWYFKDERTPECDAVLDRVVAEGAVVPPLWRLETANGLQMAVRRKRIDAAFRDHALQKLEDLPIRTDPDCQKHEWTTIVSLSDRFGLTVYDAAYIELAERLRVPLASRDKRMRAAGHALNLVLLGLGL